MRKDTLRQLFFWKKSMQNIISQILPPLVPIFTPNSWLIMIDMVKMVKIIHINRLVVLNINDVNAISAFSNKIEFEKILIAVTSDRHEFYELLKYNAIALSKSILSAASLGSHGAQSLLSAYQNEGFEHGAAPVRGAVQWLEKGGVPRDIELRLCRVSQVIQSSKIVFLSFENTIMLLDAKYGELIIMNCSSWREVLNLWKLIKMSTNRGAWVLLSSPGDIPKEIKQDVCVKSCKRVLLEDNYNVRQGWGVLLG